VEQWKNNWKDYYATLGVCMSAEPEVIRGAYNAMARKYHPDVNPTGATRMKDVNEAFEVLSDSLKKADYDAAYRARWQSRQGSGSSAGSGQRNSGGSWGDNGQGRGWYQGSANTGSQRGESSGTWQQGSAGGNGR